MSVITNSGTPSTNPKNPIFEENYLQTPFKSTKESIVGLANYIYDGALVGMMIGSSILVQETIRDAWSNCILTPEKDLTCLEPNRVGQLHRTTILIGAFVGGMAGAMGLNPRLCSMAASAALVCTGLFSQKLNLEPFHDLGVAATGLSYLSLLLGGLDRLRDVANTLFNGLE